MARLRTYVLIGYPIVHYLFIIQPSTPSEALVETLAILSILISRFPVHVSNSSLDPQPLTVLAPLLNHQRPVVRKRAIITLSQFIPISQPALFEALLNTSVFPNLAPSASLDKQRTTVQLVAAIARHCPHQISPVLDKIVPGILEAIQKDDEELREGSLQALEALALRLPTEVTPYLGEIVQIGLQFIKYDPVSYFCSQRGCHSPTCPRIMLEATTKTRKWQTLMMTKMTMMIWTSALKRFPVRLYILKWI